MSAKNTVEALLPWRDPEIPKRNEPSDGSPRRAARRSHARARDGGLDPRKARCLPTSSDEAVGRARI
jgi:hypothetical protein